jgi:hypothetical protein
VSAETAIAVRSWAVGPYTCEMTVQRPKLSAIMSAVVEWSPSEPSRLTAEEWRQYRNGRNQALAKLAAELGISVAVLEL